MKYCPNCKRDFEDHVTFCRWCEVDTVDSLDVSPDAAKEKGGISVFSDGGKSGEKVCILSTFDVLTIAKIEESLKAAGIPVEVKESEPISGEEDEETGEAREEAEETEEDFVPFEEPKKGFFSRLFGRKTQEEPDTSCEDELFDVLVPEELKDDALNVMNAAFGIIGAEGYGIDNGDYVEETDGVEETVE